MTARPQRAPRAAIAPPNASALARRGLREARTRRISLPATRSGITSRCGCKCAALPGSPMRSRRRSKTIAIRWRSTSFGTTGLHPAPSDPDLHAGRGGLLQRPADPLGPSPDAQGRPGQPRRALLRVGDREHTGAAGRSAARPTRSWSRTPPWTSSSTGSSSAGGDRLQRDQDDHHGDRPHRGRRGARHHHQPEALRPYGRGDRGAALCGPPRPRAGRT